MKNVSSPIRLATRQSKLALWQAEYVRDQLLRYHPKLTVTLVPMLTQGDLNQQSSQADTGKALFVKELQRALLDNVADIAVHSLKDLSVYETPGLHLAAVCRRADPRDVLISPQYSSLTHLPSGSLIGTTSPRRQSQLLACRPDLVVKTLRGNIDTRVQKVLQADFAGIILAAAGIHRLKLQQHITEYLSLEQFIPAIGQGAIVVECRNDDILSQQWLAPLNHTITHACITAERAVNRRLGGDCMTPLAAYADYQPDQNQLKLKAMVASLDGRKMIHAQHIGKIAHAEQIGYELADLLLAQGASELLSL